MGTLLRFTQAARKHRIGKAHARHVLSTTAPQPISTKQGEPGWLYIGNDERGVELEIIAVQPNPEQLFIIHVMPTALKKGNQ